MSEYAGSIEGYKMVKTAIFMILITIKMKIFL